MIYVAAALGVSHLLSDSPGERAMLLIGLLALGSSQLWFGHVENYSAVSLLLVTTPGPSGNDAADRAGWGLP